MTNTNISNITRVYNGKIGCMCGCLGKYTGNPAFYDADGNSTAHIGVDSAVSARSVKIIAKKVLSHPDVEFDDNVAYVLDKVRNRVQAVYFAESVDSQVNL